jgi:drug/metabolite transporter (DMT)-like permease
MKWQTWCVFVALGIIWGIPYFFIKLTLQELSPWVVAWSRILLATLILLPIAWRRGALRSVRSHLLPILAFAVVEFTVPFAVIPLGERWIASSVTGIIIAGAPLTAVLISRFFGLHEPLGRWRLSGLLLGLAGVIALLGLGTISGPLGWLGVGCMLLATVGYAIGPLIIQRFLGTIDAFGPIAVSLLFSTALLTPPALLNLPAYWPEMTTVGSIAILGVVCTATAMLLMFYLVRTAGAARALVITYINPIVATLMGVGLLHEHLGAGGYIAFVLILLGSWLATRGAPVPVEHAA